MLYLIDSTNLIVSHNVIKLKFLHFQKVLVFFFFNYSMEPGGMELEFEMVLSFPTWVL